MPWLLNGCMKVLTPRPSPASFSRVAEELTVALLRLMKNPVWCERERIAVAIGKQILFDVLEQCQPCHFNYVWISERISQLPEAKQREDGVRRERNGAEGVGGVGLQEISEEPGIRQPFGIWGCQGECLRAVRQVSEVAETELHSFIFGNRLVGLRSQTHRWESAREMPLGPSCREAFLAASLMRAATSVSRSGEKSLKGSVMLMTAAARSS